MELTRKCKICGKNIFIERDRSTFFYDKTGFYHKDCFVDKKKNEKQRRDRLYEQRRDGRSCQNE